MCAVYRSHKHFVVSLEEEVVKGGAAETNSSLGFAYNVKKVGFYPPD